MQCQRHRAAYLCCDQGGTGVNRQTGLSYSPLSNIRKI
jgi:hypothetical protein